MSIKEKMSKNDKFGYTQKLDILNFHHFTRFLSHFSTFTLMLNEEATVNEKEEEVIAHLLAYELSCTFGERIMFPSIKNEFLLKVQEVCKHNFLIPNVTPNKIRSIAYGNFHELHKQPSSFVYSKYNSSEFKSIASQLTRRLKLDSENAKGYLQAYIESPGVLSIVYKIARLLLVKNSHICLVGPPRMHAREYLQLACLVYPDTDLFEPEVKPNNDIVAFKNSFKSAILKTVRQNKDMVFHFDKSHINDQVYLDCISNYINMFDRDSIDMFDQELCDKLIQAQKEYMNELSEEFPDAKNLKKAVGHGNPRNTNKELYSYEHGLKGNKELTGSEYYTLATGILAKKFHVVISVNGLQEYNDLNKYH